jgi:hypothetical protein
MKKTLIVSIPKAGTYFFSEVLKNLGLRQTWLHLNVDHYEDYTNADFDTAQKKPTDFTCNVKLADALASINAGDFAVGHLPAGNRYLEKGGVVRNRLLEDFSVFFLVRDLRKCIISLMNFELFMRESSSDYKEWPDQERLVRFLQEREESLYHMYKGLLPWFWQKQVTVLRYENLIAADVGSFAGFGAGEIREAIRIALATQTLTSSTRESTIEKYWSGQADKLYRRRIAGINNVFGYDLAPGRRGNLVRDMVGLRYRTGFVLYEACRHLIP